MEKRFISREDIFLILHRIIYGLALIFVGSLLLISFLIIFVDDSILIPKGRSIFGLIALWAVTAAVFRHKEMRYAIINNGSTVGVIMLLLYGVFFTGSHPMYKYAAIRTCDSDGYIIEDEMYFRHASIVKRLESRGTNEYHVERYLYSPRLGIFLGKTLGTGEGAPEMRYETSGFSAWFSGIRVACEQFTFFAINLLPFLIGYSIYRYRKNIPKTQSIALDPVKALFLIGPFILGLIPLIGT